MKNNYLNLKYLIQYHPYHIDTFAGFAHVTTELLKEVLAGREELTDAELFRISKYTGVPMSVLNCPKLITLNRNRHRHRVMMDKLGVILGDISDCQKKGSHEADTYMKYWRKDFVNMELAFLDNRSVPYTQYLGIQHQMQDTWLYILNEQIRIHNKPRGVKAS